MVTLKNIFVKDTLSVKFIPLTPKINFKKNEISMMLSFFILTMQ